ncbi:MAG: hypothetical protein HY606_06430 [Planctomycetes bacterium]|nr:hypothetical protein [Planctomycetota bacterium]
MGGGSSGGGHGGGGGDGDKDKKDPLGDKNSPQAKMEMQKQKEAELTRIVNALHQALSKLLGESKKNYKEWSEYWKNGTNKKKFTEEDSA